MNERRRAYSCPWFDVVEESIGEKSETTYSIVEPTRPSVVTVVSDTTGAILFVKVPRWTTGAEEWELPAGRIEGDETVTQAASREVAEEAGIGLATLHEIGTIFPMNGMSSAAVHVCHSAVELRPNKEREAEFESCWMNKREIDAHIARNELRDGVTLAALMVYWAAG